MNPNQSMSRFSRTLLGSALVIASASASAATIVIQSRDPAGVGFNDTTPVAPVGGNTGTTLGEQRLNVYRFVADLWAAELDSAVPITVSAGWEALSCTASTATLGSAGAWNAWFNFPGAPQTGTWYGQALANKLAGVNLSADNPDDGTGYGNVDIKTQFNVNLGKADCLAGAPFYLGLDGAAGSLIDFSVVLLHELGHGLGFQTFTSGRTGAQLAGLPSAWDRFILDNTTGKNWVEMTATERALSGVNGRHLVWTGANVAAAVPMVLALGTPAMTISSPSNIAGSYSVGPANFGPALNAAGGISGFVGRVLDQPNGTGLACDPLSAANAKAVAGRVAMVDRGVCSFAVKVKNVQDAGATAVLVVDNAAGSPPAGLGASGTAIDALITIPSVRISIDDGNIIKSVLASVSRRNPNPSVSVVLGVDPLLRAGADSMGRAMLYSPNPYINGSSISHYDTLASPNQLMEPNINSDLTKSVRPPKDMTKALLKDIGW